MEKNVSANDRIVNFFDEMNIIRTKKSERIQTAQKLYRLYDAFLIDVWNDIVDGTFLHEKPIHDYIQRAETIFLNVAAEDIKGLENESETLQKAHHTAVHILETTQKKLLMHPEEIDFHVSIQFGIPLKEEQIPDDIKKAIKGESRVVDIATNESLWMHSYQNHKEKVENGQATHTWETMKDDRVRDTHIAVDGQTVPIDEPFIVDGYRLMFPGDISDDPPADLVVNCRCMEL
jgi:hypothetical protein